MYLCSQSGSMCMSTSPCTSWQLWHPGSCINISGAQEETTFQPAINPTSADLVRDQPPFLERVKADMGSRRVRHKVCPQSGLGMLHATLCVQGCTVEVQWRCMEDHPRQQQCRTNKQRWAASQLHAKALHADQRPPVCSMPGAQYLQRLHSLLTMHLSVCIISRDCACRALYGTGQQWSAAWAAQSRWKLPQAVCTSLPICGKSFQNSQGSRAWVCPTPHMPPSMGSAGPPLPKVSKAAAGIWCDRSCRSAARQLQGRLCCWQVDDFLHVAAHAVMQACVAHTDAVACRPAGLRMQQTRCMGGPSHCSSTKACRRVGSTCSICLHRLCGQFQTAGTDIDMLVQPGARPISMPQQPPGRPLQAPMRSTCIHRPIMRCCQLEPAITSSSSQDSGALLKRWCCMSKA